MKSRPAGFTLIELMIVVAIVGLLAAIALPKFGNLVEKSRESSTKGKLGAMRSALSIYHSDTEGSFPTGGIDTLTLGGKYIDFIPTVAIPKYGHLERGDWPGQGANVFVDDQGGWGYCDQGTAGCNGVMGLVAINCVHTDVRGTTWSAW